MSFTSRWSDVVIASVAQLMAALGTFLVMTTLVLALQERGGSGLQVALLVVAETLPVVVLARWVGRLVDRVDSRLLLIVAGLGQVGAAFALAYASRYEWIVAGAVALACATAIAQPTRSALLPAMVTREDLARANAIGQTAGSIGMMAGPSLAGLLVGTVAVEQTLRVSALAFAFTVLAGVLLRTRRGGTAAQPAAADRPKAAPVTWQLRDDRMYWVMVWSLALIIGLVSAVNVAEVFFVRETLGASAVLYGVVTSAWTVGMLVGAWVLARLIRPATADGALVRWIFFGLAVICGAVLLCGTVTAALWIIPCWLAGGLVNGGQNVIAGTLLGRRVPPEARGRAAAAVQSRVQGGGLAGFFLGGVVLDLIDARWVVLGAGALGLLGILLVMPVVRGVTATGRTSPQVQATAA
ncbi:MFS transporter [Catellatospora tritici]|uniref:MFS transporter n=1 Tax=Catellatospora tritici TaxID=2851566 RepID=UPI001C2D6EA6|nr:MFS transporter [Catellatospora tritici]MBV1851990.1 MFS transporter [Catellatospora tritici]